MSKGGVTFVPAKRREEARRGFCSFLPSQFQIISAYGHVGELIVDFATTKFIKRLQAAGTVLGSGDCPRVGGSVCAWSDVNH